MDPEKAWQEVKHYFGTQPTSQSRSGLFIHKVQLQTIIILRFRHQPFKVGTDTDGQSVVVKLKYYLEYLATNR